MIDTQLTSPETTSAQEKNWKLKQTMVSEMWVKSEKNGQKRERETHTLRDRGMT